MIMSEAEEVKVIGYSFDSVDREYVITTLLSKAVNCKRILVLNPEADKVVRSMKEDRFLRDQAPQLRDRFVECRCKFGERFDLP